MPASLTATLALADEFQELLEADVYEEVKANLIYAKHCDIGQDDYIAVWLVLDAPTRRAWKGFITMSELEYDKQYKPW